jgi:serine/threonine protein kinase HipA of HipAB toxin-antitoxin module
MPDSSRDTRTNDLPEVTTRNRIARHLIEGFSAAFPADIWRYLATAFADIPALSAEITRLRAELASARLDLANLAAAALATLAAHGDGEPDPLSYLRDELRAQGHDTSRGGA